VKEVDLEKCAQEVKKLRLLPPIAIEIPPVAAIELISYVQSATHNPVIGNSEFGKMVIDVAKQLQNSFDPNSECYKLLEFGWELQADRRQKQELLERVLRIFDSAANISTNEEEDDGGD